MLNPAVCASAAASLWGQSTSLLVKLFMNPQWVVPPLVGLTLLPWLLQIRRRKWLYSSVSGAVLLIYLLLGSSIAIGVGERLLTGFLPVDVGESAQAIVILGRGPELRSQRVATAVALWQANPLQSETSSSETSSSETSFTVQEHRAPLIFVSGTGDALEIAALLEEQGIPAAAIDGEPCSRTTEENAQFTAALLQPRGIQRILLVTDSPHLMRSWLTFRSLGFEVIPHASPLPQMSERKTAFLVVRECFGFFTYGLLGRYQPRLVSAAPAAELAAPAMKG